MKRQITKADILAIILFTLSVIETVVAAVYSVVHWHTILLMQLVNIVGIILACYSYSIAKYSNRWHSFWRRENRENVDETPSGCAVVLMKVSGYGAIFLVAVSYLIFGILQALTI